MKRIFTLILSVLCLITAQTAWAYTQEELSTPLTLEFPSGGKVTITNPKSLTIKYSTDGGTKTASSANPITITVAGGKTLQLYGTNTSYGGGADDNSTMISCSADCYIYGNIMSLVDEENFAMKIGLAGAYTFSYLFENNTRLKNHNSNELVLPATTLEAAYCYRNMFEGCTGLTTAPALPAETLAEACYQYMFKGCTALTTAPELPATTLTNNCYLGMFSGCTGLTTAPALPATTLARDCYHSMFDGCTNLNYVKCLATDLTATRCTTFWLNGVAETGTFVKAAGASWGSGVSGIPSNWAKIDFDSSKSNNTYTVHYEANGGSGEMSDQTFTYYEPQKLRANAFTRSGYTFVGWSTTTNGTVVYSDQQNVAAMTTENSITLYAQWVEE